jgi:hypothetical protein
VKTSFLSPEDIAAGKKRYAEIAERNRREAGITATSSAVMSLPPAKPAPPEPPAPKPELPWPELHSKALYGLVGEIVNAIKPETESDPVAILIQLLVFFGNAIGRNAHFRIEDTEHHANLFVCLVGASSRARKGTSEGRVHHA